MLSPITITVTVAPLTMSTGPLDAAVRRRLAHDVAADIAVDEGRDALLAGMPTSTIGS